MYQSTPEVEADHIHLEFDCIVVLNNGADNGILDLAVMKLHADQSSTSAYKGTSVHCCEENPS